MELKELKALTKEVGEEILKENNNTKYKVIFSNYNNGPVVDLAEPGNTNNDIHANLDLAGVLNSINKDSKNTPISRIKRLLKNTLNELYKINSKANVSGISNADVDNAVKNLTNVLPALRMKSTKHRHPVLTDEFNTMNIEYQVDLKRTDEEVYTTAITLDNLIKNKYTKEDVVKKAMENLAKAKFEIKTIEDAIKEDIAEEEKEGEPLLDTLVRTALQDTDDVSIGHVLVTCAENKINGANVLLRPDVFEKVADELKCDLYLLPVSVHEVIIVSTNEFDLSQVIKQLEISNKTLDKSDDKLSEIVYKYNKEFKTISPVFVTSID